METVSPIYSSHAKCPVCESEFEYTKVRSKAIKLKQQDSDFCPWYEGENPVLYEAVICPECGYGSHITNIDKISRNEKAKVREKISSRWHKRSFSGKRDIDKALEAFKIVLLNLKEREAPSSEIAKISMRIAWLYRYKEDRESEKAFLNYALKYYVDSFKNEDFSRNGIDTYTLIFIIGELYRRLEHYEDSMQWFSRLIQSYSDPAKKDKIPPRLIDTARDLIQEIKQDRAMA
ncbi:MAG: DUF2225 domain-containing protein [Clostridiaceae bacterium]|nr:DUF2225 domain-containing protein [Clostridiaceae bacterium]